jgi:hypothetical protein
LTNFLRNINPAALAGNLRPRLSLLFPFLLLFLFFVTLHFFLFFFALRKALVTIRNLRKNGRWL